MKTMMKVLAASTVAMAAASAASAQDMGDTVPFQGFYVGASGGYDVQPNDGGSRLLFDRNGDGNFNDTVRTAAGADAFSPGFCGGRALTNQPQQGCAPDRDRWAYYGRAGYDTRFGNFVVGAVGEFGKTEIRDFTSGFSTTPAFYVMERSVRWEASARLRAGAAFGSGMFYATGGAGYADIRHRFSTDNTANSFTPNNDGKREWGYVAGGGVEKYLTRNISLGVEYLYHDYKDDDYFVTVGRGTAPATNPFVLAPNPSTVIARSDDNFRWHSLRANINFRF